MKYTKHTFAFAAAFAIASSVLFHDSTGLRFSRRDSDTTVISKASNLKFVASSVTRCSSGDCMVKIKKEIGSYPSSSYYLVYKNGRSEWILNRAPSMRLVQTLPAKEIAILDGTVSILGNDYSDRKHVVIFR